jgi:hypothetical protein
MPHDHDYSPVVDSGVIEQERGILGRALRRQTLPPVGNGFERVFVNNDGTVVAGGERFSAGERYWSAGTGWVKVDVTSHPMDFRFAVRPNSDAGFEVAITADVRVTNSQRAAQERARSARELVGPTLHQQLRAALQEPPPDRVQGEPADWLNRMRFRLDRTLNESLVTGHTLMATDWLSVHVKAVTAEFDQATADHFEALAEERRKGELLGARGINALAGVDQEIELRGKWRDHFKDHLSDPELRSIELVVGAPTQENIASTIALLNSQDVAKRKDTLALLGTLIEGNYIPHVDQATIRALISGLERGSRRPQPASEHLGEIDSSASATEDEAVTAEIVVEEVADSDWD